MNRAQKLGILLGIIPAGLGRKPTPALQRVVNKLCAETGIGSFSGRSGDELIEQVATELESELSSEADL